MNEYEYIESLKILDEIYFAFARNEKRFENSTRDLSDLNAVVFQRLLQIMFLIDPSFLDQCFTYNLPVSLTSPNRRPICQSYTETARKSLQREFLAGKVSADCRRWMRDNWEFIFLV